MRANRKLTNDDEDLAMDPDMRFYLLEKLVCTIKLAPNLLAKSLGL